MSFLRKSLCDSRTQGPPAAEDFDMHFPNLLLWVSQTGLAEMWESNPLLTVTANLFAGILMTRSQYLGH